MNRFYVLTVEAIVAMLLVIASSTPSNAEAAENEQSKSATEDFNTAVDLKDRGRIAEAIALYKSLVAKDPKFYQAYSNLGEAYLSLGKEKEAMSAYTKAIEINGKDTITLAGLAKIYSNKREYEKAISTANRCLLLDPKLVPCYMTKGRALDKQKQYPQAIAQYEVAVKLDPSLSDAHESRCAIAARMGSESELIKAVREWRRAIPNDPKRKTIDELLGTE